MNKKINSLQLGTVLVLLVLSAFFNIGIYRITSIAGVDAYLSVILGGIIGVICLLIVFYISNYNHSLPINKVIINLFGKYIGMLINIILIIIVFIMGVSYMFTLINFAVSHYLNETPFIIIGLAFSTVIIYANIKGIETITRVGLILFVINIILYLISIIGVIPSFDKQNLLPFLENGLVSPFKGSIYYVIVNILPIFLLLIIPKNRIIDKKNYNKTLLIFYITSVILTFIMLIVTIGVLGIDLTNAYQYSEYVILKEINILNFIDRIENFVTIQWLFSLFFSLTFIVYYISNTIKFDNKSKLLPSVITLSILITTLLFKSNTDFSEFSLNNYPYITFSLIIIFVIIIVAIIFKKIIKKKAL